jgi:DNA repair protein RadC
MSEETTLIREVAVSYRGAHRKVESPLRSPADVVHFVRRTVSEDAREHFLAIYLDGRHRPIGFQTVSVGTATASLIHPREVFQPAIGIGAVALIAAHNHPSSDPSPSAEDREVTERLIKAGNLLGIELVDHLVVAGFGFTSFKEESPALFDKTKP